MEDLRDWSRAWARDRAWKLSHPDFDRRSPATILGDLDLLHSPLPPGLRQLDDIPAKLGVQAMRSALQKAWEMNEARQPVRDLAARKPD
jgi:hypothetical protein